MQHMRHFAVVVDKQRPLAALLLALLQVRSPAHQNINVTIVLLFRQQSKLRPGMGTVVAALSGNKSSLLCRQHHVNLCLCCSSKENPSFTILSVLAGRQP